MNVAIVGSGAIAQVHAESLHKLGLSISAVSGVDKESVELFASKYGIGSTYLGHQELFCRKDLDMVIIATPSDSHAQISKAAILAGISVLCEVPAALNFDDYKSVSELAKEKGVLAGIAQTLRYSAPHVQLSQILEARATLPLSVHVRYHILRQDNTGWTGLARTWTDNVFWHHGAHNVDLALWMLNPNNPQVNLAHGPIWDNGLPMEMIGTITSDDLRYASISLSYHSRHPRNELLVIIEDVTYEIVHGILSENGRVISPNPGGEQILSEAVVNQNRVFLEALESGEDSQVFTFEKAHNVMSYIEKGYPKELAN